MGAVPAPGVTHFPPLVLPDDHMKDVFRWARVALIASSSWSHAFLSEASDFLPDANPDREMFQHIEDNKPSAWREVAFDQVEAAREQKSHVVLSCRWRRASWRVPRVALN
jgi:hypothetical protein